MTKTISYLVIAVIVVAAGVGGYVVLRERTEVHVEKVQPESRGEVARHGDKFSERFQPKLPN